MTQNAINNTASILAVDNLTLDGNTLSSTDTNGDIVLFPDGTGTVSVTLAPIVPTGDRADSLGSATNSWDNLYADGVSFDDGSNVMSAYSEGTWTPALTFGGGSTGITYSTQEGTYTRIGNTVFYTLFLQISNKGSSTGAAAVTGLPFTVGGNNYTSTVGGYGLINLTAAYTTVGIRANTATTTAGLLQSGDNVVFATITDAEYGNTSLVTTTGFYIV